MATVLEVPKRRERRRRREAKQDDQQTNEGASVASVASTIQGSGSTEDLMKNLKDLQRELVEIESQLTLKQKKVGEKRELVKSKVTDAFDVLHELLERKECELNAKVESAFDILDGVVKEDLEKLHKLKDPLDESIDKQMYGVDALPDQMLSRIHTDTQTQMRMNVIDTSTDNIPDVDFVSDCNSIIENLKVGDIITSVAGSTNGENNNVASEESETRSQSNSSVSQNTVPEGNNQPTIRSEPSEASIGSASGSSENDNRRYATFEDFDDSSLEGAPGYDPNAEAQPSAPPLDMLEPGEDPPEDPPPYWQAVGLDGPPAGPTSPSAPPSNNYTEPVPEYTEFDSNPGPARNNILELWHSFPIRKQYDTRKALYIALSWDLKIISVADRANKKIKFFDSNGQPLTEMRISGEIHDIAFLESYRGESRYIVSLPKERMLLLVSLFEDNSTHIVTKIKLDRIGAYYTAICRGPKAQTLVGATTVVGSGYMYHTERPRVELFDFQGAFLLEFLGNRSFRNFQFPRAVDVFGDKVIVADWKMNVVAMFQDNGAMIGEYHGTNHSPLLNPLDMTMDPFGNVLVVDGENPSIHVISPEGFPIEVLKVPRCGSEWSKAKLVAFDKHSRGRLAIIMSSGDMAIFKFYGGYRVIRPGEVSIHPDIPSVPANESLPYVEGMLPTTIASIGRNRSSSRRSEFTL